MKVIQLQNQPDTYILQQEKTYQEYGVVTPLLFHHSEPARSFYFGHHDPEKHFTVFSMENMNSSEFTQQQLLEMVEAINPRKVILDRAGRETDLFSETHYTEWASSVPQHKLVAWIEGEDIRQATELFDRLVEKGCTNFAINIDSPFLMTVSFSPNDEARKALSRIDFLNYLKLTDRWKSEHTFILTGKTTTSELGFYEYL